MSIEVQNITRTFGSFMALSDVTLSVPSGQIVALLGPSGSGKTTLLRIIAGLDDPDPDTDGRVLFQDADVTTLGVEHRNVGFVFQHYALFRHLTVFENVAFGLRVQPRRRRLPTAAIVSRVEDMLALVQLAGLGARFPHQLSGGQRQRVALARALVVKPGVLLLDEPFGALDASVRQDLRRWLRTLHDQLHLTTVFVTHDQEEALELADQVAILHGGRVLQVGTPDEVYHRPESPFVLRFLGKVERFTVQVRQGRAELGGLSVAVGPEGPTAGTAALYVRPVDWEPHAHPPGASSLRGTVQRVRSVGPVVRVEVRCSAAGSVSAELPHARWRSLGLIEGDEIYLTTRAARVFER